jgi:hypothetical protein
MEHADRGCGRPRSRRPCPGSRGSAPRRRRRRRRRDRAGWSLRMLLIGKRVDLSEVILSDALSRRQVWIAYISPPRPTCAAAARGGPQKHRIRASRHGSRAATAGLVRRDVASAVGCVNSAAPHKTSNLQARPIYPPHRVYRVTSFLALRPDRVAGGSALLRSGASAERDSFRLVAEPPSTDSP